MTLWVIKIGTSLLRGSKEVSTTKVIENLSEAIADSKSKGDQVVLVTSGAVGLGCYQLGKKNRPESIVDLQAAAAVGQGYLIALYEANLRKYNYNVAQVLVTRSDLQTRNNYRNASMTLKKLLEWNVIPIVNENDTLSTEELNFGDNDTLSALVAIAIDADQLILLTDVDKLYSSDPRNNPEARPITEVHNASEIKNIEQQNTQNSNWGTGGIKTKLAAAKIATESGITVQLADGRNPESLGEILNGSRGGTIFHPSPIPLGNRKSWLAHALHPLGSLELDHGACVAIKDRGASLLLVGIKGIQGNFEANQPVKILDTNGEELARGLSSMSSADIRYALSKPLTFDKSPVIVHRDVLVITSKTFT